MIASVAGTYPITPSATGTNLANYTVSATQRHPHHHPGLNQLHHHLDPRCAHLRDRPRRRPVERHFHHRRNLHLHPGRGHHPARRRPDPLRHLHPNRYRRLRPPTVTATLTVNKATLTLTAANASRPYNTPNPTFTGTLSGAVNGDTFTESFATTAMIGLGRRHLPHHPKRNRHEPRQLHRQRHATAPSPSPRPQPAPPSPGPPLRSPTGQASAPPS